MWEINWNLLDLSHKLQCCKIQQPFRSFAMIKYDFGDAFFDVAIFFVCLKHRKCAHCTPIYFFFMNSFRIQFQFTRNEYEWNNTNVTTSLSASIVGYLYWSIGAFFTNISILVLHREILWIWVWLTEFDGQSCNHH